MSEPPPPIVRLNRRVIYVVGAVLIVAVVTGLLAIRAQGTRLTDTSAEHRAGLPPRARPWFEAVADQAPAPPRALDRPALALSAASAKESIDDETRRRHRVWRAAMSAPIGVAAFGRSGDGGVARRREGHDNVVAAPDERTTSVVPTERLRASLRKPASPYEVKAGTLIPAVMLTGINSDLPGQTVGQVRENVYDSDTGEHLLIPQGSRLVGLYDHHVVYGQQRVLIAWKRLLLPDGSSLSLGDGMPATDGLGAAGFHDEVNNHYLRVFGNALLLSTISAGVQLSQAPDFGRDFRGPTAGSVLGGALGQQLGSVASELIRRGMNIAPTLEIRPGYAFNVMVTHDVVFPGPYEEAKRS